MVPPNVQVPGLTRHRCLRPSAGRRRNPTKQSVGYPDPRSSTPGASEDATRAEPRPFSLDHDRVDRRADRAAGCAAAGRRASRRTPAVTGAVGGELVEHPELAERHDRGRSSAPAVHRVAPTRRDPPAGTPRRRWCRSPPPTRRDSWHHSIGRDAPSPGEPGEVRRHLGSGLHDGSQSDEVARAHEHHVAGAQLAAPRAPTQRSSIAPVDRRVRRREHVARPRLRATSSSTQRPTKLVAMTARCRAREAPPNDRDVARPVAVVHRVADASRGRTHPTASTPAAASGTCRRSTGSRGPAPAYGVPAIWSRPVIRNQCSGAGAGVEARAGRRRSAGASENTLPAADRTAPRPQSLLLADQVLRADLVVGRPTAPSC